MKTSWVWGDGSTQKALATKHEDLSLIPNACIRVTPRTGEVEKGPVEPTGQSVWLIMSSGFNERPCLKKIWWGVLEE